MARIKLVLKPNITLNVTKDVAGGSPISKREVIAAASRSDTDLGKALISVPTSSKETRIGGDVLIRQANS